jgi:hypothetical protein
MLMNPPKRVAAVITEYRKNSHADVIVGKILEGFDQRGGKGPDLQVVSMYVDQFPATDMSRDLAKKHGVSIRPTIAEALTLGGDKLAVDGVLNIGEHGQYPFNEKGQHLYPRRRFFDETAAAFREAGAVAPVFNDKHLAALWPDAKHMYETARAMGIPFMAGSSLPLAWRRPWLELPLGAEVEEALAVGYGGDEAYGFHALETLQCMVERRRGGETGVRAVEALRGEAVWKAMDEGRFSRDLVEAALARHDPPLAAGLREQNPQSAAFLIEYRDGLRAVVLMLERAGRFLFAARLRGYTRPVATQFWLQEPSFGHFSYLAHAISELVLTGTPVYPVERTVITTGVLAAAMDSLFEKGKRIETPDLAIAYAPADHSLGAYRNAEAANERSGGWVELFDGKSLDGWLVHEYRGAPRWEISGGVLRGTSGQGYLATVEVFDDFELFAEMRISDSAGGRGNSGIYFRCQPHADLEKEYPEGYEAQCDHGDEANPTGSIYNLATAGARAPRARVKDGEWFTMRIRAEGHRLRTWVNGEPAADCVDPQKRYASGYVLLQLHHATAVVEFREVRIRRLG